MSITHRSSQWRPTETTLVCGCLFNFLPSTIYIFSFFTSFVKVNARVNINLPSSSARLWPVDRHFHTSNNPWKVDGQEIESLWLGVQQTEMWTYGGKGAEWAQSGTVWPPWILLLVCTATMAHRIPIFFGPDTFRYLGFIAPAYTSYNLTQVYFSFPKCTTTHKYKQYQSHITS